MAGPRIVNPYEGMPPWLQEILIGLSTSPVTSAVPTKIAGKPIADLLGKVMTPTGKKTGVPRVHMTSMDPDAATAVFHNPDTFDTAFDVGLGDLKKLVEGGALQPEGPPQGSVVALVKRLQAILGPQ